MKDSRFPPGSNYGFYERPGPNPHFWVDDSYVRLDQIISCGWIANEDYDARIPEDSEYYEEELVLEITLAGSGQVAVYVKEYGDQIIEALRAYTEAL